MERICVIIKPDAVNRQLIGEIISRFERKGMKVIGMKMERLEQGKLEEHYGHHKDKPFFEGLVKFMSSIPAVVIALEGKDCIEIVRRMAGATSGRKADIGSIRGDYSMSQQYNIVHASDSVEEAEKELKRFFKPEQLMDYDLLSFNWLYSEDERE